MQDSKPAADSPSEAAPAEPAAQIQATESAQQQTTPHNADDEETTDPDVPPQANFASCECANLHVTLFMRAL